jgi:hypothetical protein
MPLVVAASATRGLFVGDVKAAAGGALASLFEGVRVGGVDGGEVMQAVGEDGASKGGAECDRVEMVKALQKQIPFGTTDQEQPQVLRLAALAQDDTRVSG